MDEYRRSLQGRENLIHHQGITILTQLSGKQFVTATASNLGSRKAYLTVAIGSVILTIRSRKAALRYAKVWVHFSTYALTMPQWTPGNARVTRYNEPGVMVAVTDRDPITTTPSSQGVTIGRVSWEVLDDQAFNSFHEMWREA